jgi:hypothetical protein
MADSLDDRRPLYPHGLWTTIDAALKSLGTANAAGAFGVAASLQFITTQSPQTAPAFKVLILIFLFGILTYAMAYMAYTMVLIDYDNWVAAGNERISDPGQPFWWSHKKDPAKYLKSMKRSGLLLLITAGLSACCFFTGLLGAIGTIARLL